jgi:hypothetical protein
VNPLATRIGVAYSDMRYRRVRCRYLDLTAQVQCNENLEQHAVTAGAQQRVARLNR